ncbi:MORC family CW-type zinc finger protein 2-like isoform X2 [Acanthaster planci]|uniref:MORC family CW-type zinc finger protein 2-like isoform X2 n=1 Tax=Acanthaster planci TaxID=133434 RepID=A0A8B7YSQ9_ACAPL|nr:MORC family CW-type zinc finger protein 2-like isoform X2 [Acanthaster planci]
MVVYQGLSRAQLSFDYLHTNSTTHEFLFGALAELLDNARDARARRMDVFTDKNETLRGGYMLCFLDDGSGMDPAEVGTVIQFGKSTKRVMDSNMIGQYGNGLKSGAMRIGKDFILFTKQGATMSCLFLSRTFHEEEKIEEVIVPMPSFEKNTRHPFGQSSEEKQRHKIEMDLIYKYSPFKTEEDFFAQFDRIDGDSGTLVIIYHMKLMDNGETELDVTTDASDILLAGAVSAAGVPDDSLVPERQSFRAYTSILYAEPKMKIYIQGHKVHTRRLAYTLYKPKLYKYTSTRFKTRSEMKATEAVHQAKVANEKAREAESKARDLEKKHGQGGPKDKRAMTRQAQTVAFELRQLANIRKKIAEKQQKSLKEPKTINFHFGINLSNRRYDGVFIYNCGRLIKMYERVGPQVDGGVQCSGVVGFVDVPYLVLEPTHNKQDFADAKEYRHLLKAMGEHMVQYWKDINVASLGVTKFWENFGYVSQNWKDPPSEDPKFVRKRAMQTSVLVQCDACLKWRIIPFSSSNINRVFPDDWQCSMNPDSTHNRCSSAEQKVPIASGVFKKEVKSAEEQKKELLEDIKKKQEKLGKIETSLPSSTPPKPIGKASPVQSYKEKPTSRPVGKAAPVVNQQQSRRPSTQTTASSKPASATVSKYSSPVAKHDSRKIAAIMERKTASRPQKQSPAPPVPVAKKVYATKRQSTNSITPASNTRNEEKPPEPAKKRRLTERSQISTDEEMDVSKEEDSSDSTSLGSDTQLEIESVGKRVEARVDNKWYSGKVVKVFLKQDGAVRWKIKFDQHPKDKYDKSYDKNSEDIREIQDPPALAEDNQPEPLEVAPVDIPPEPEATPSPLHEPAVQKVTPTAAAPPTAAMSPQAVAPPNTPKTTTTTTPKATVPPSMAAVAPSADTDEVEESVMKEERLAQGFRKCLRYFLPPLWPMNKEMINNLSMEELSDFPLDDFFDQYEKGLRNLVGGFQAEAAEKARETEATKIKLGELRKLIAQLLRSINDEIVVSDTAGEEVDVMLAACVKQAMQDE